MTEPAAPPEVELKSLRDRPFELLVELERRGRASSTRVPGARAWIKGLANVRGQLLPIIDLRQFLGSGITLVTRNTRVVVVNHREIPAGLLVDEVLGFRRFAESEFSGDAPPTVARCERYLAGAFRRAHEQWPVLSLRSVLESPAFA